MSLVPYFKAGLLLSHKSNRAGIPALVAVKEGNVTLRNEFMGVAMTQETHTTLATLTAEFVKHLPKFAEEFPDQYLIAVTELMHDIQSTGEIPSVDLNARPLRRHAPLDLDDFDDDMEDEEEDEFLPNESDEGDESEGEVRKAVSKPIPKSESPKKVKVAKKAQAKGAKAKVKEEKVEEPAVEVAVAPSSAPSVPSTVVGVKKRGGRPKKELPTVGEVKVEDTAKPIDPAKEE